MKKLTLCVFYVLLGGFILSDSILIGQSLQELLAGEIDKVVAPDGSGDYTTIVAAINSAPDNSPTPTVIFIKNGKYIEKVEIPSTKSNLVLIGNSVDSTIISWNDYSGSGVIYNGIISSKVGQPIGTSTSHTLYIGPDDVLLMNLTVENSAGPVGQAVAINLHADKTTIIRCRIMGNQDTFYTWGKGRYFIKDTYIEGNVDFIFGRGAVLFDSCQINTNRNDCDVTAASTDTLWKFGYVFDHCKLTANPGITGISLGRPWKTNAQTVFMNSYLGTHIKSAGWSDWGGRSATCYYAEYNNYGPGYKPESRVTWAHILNETEAQRYVMDSIFSGEVNPSPFLADWDPAYASDSCYIIVRESMPLLLSDTTFNMPRLSELKYNDTVIDNFSPYTLDYGVTLPQGTTDAPLITATPLDSLARVVITNPDTLPGYATIVVTARNKATLTYGVTYTLDPNSVLQWRYNNPFQYKVLSNPFSDQFEVEYESVQESNVSLNIYTISGILVSTCEFPHISRGQFSLNTEHLRAGLYYFTLNSNGWKSGEKLVKMGH